MPSLLNVHEIVRTSVKTIQNNTHKVSRLYQSAFTCPKLTIGTLEEGVKYVQS